MKKLTIHSETVYVLSIIILAFSVAMMASVDFGLSMIVAPAYILSQKLGFITFGQAEYLIQGVLFISFLIAVRKFKPTYLFAFFTCVIYGLCLDLFRLIPIFNPNVVVPGSMDLWLRIVFFIVGELLTAFSIALCFRTYLYPQVVDFFVVGITSHFKLNRGKFKIIVDFTFLAVSVILSLCFFGKFVGIYYGTIVLTLINGPLISLFGNLIDRCFFIKPFFPKFATFFEI
jgi:uncharacterized membrane protein YczE